MQNKKKHTLEFVLSSMKSVLYFCTISTISNFIQLTLVTMYLFTRARVPRNPVLYWSKVTK